MAPASRQIGDGQVERRECGQAVTPTRRELVEQALDRAALREFELRESIERLEGGAVAVLEDEPGARQPVGLFAVNEVAEDVERAPTLAALMPGDPAGGQPSQHRVERRGRA